MGFLADLFKPKQPEEGLLSGGQNQNPDFNKLIGLSLLTRVTGGANSPYANLIPMMSQMQQAKRQQDLMDLDKQKFSLEQEKFGLTKQQFEEAMKQKQMQDAQMMAQQKNLQDFSKSVLNPPAPPTTYGYGYSITDPNAQAQIPSIPSKEEMSNAKKRVYAANLVRTGEAPNMKLAMEMLGFGEAKTLKQGESLVSPLGQTIASMAPEQKPTELQKALAIQDAKSIGEMRDKVNQSAMMMNSLDEFESSLKKVPSSLIGRTVGSLGPYFSNNAQVADTAAKQVSLLAKSLLGMPNNNFSDADRQFLVDATVGANKSVEANMRTIARLKSLYHQQVDYLSKMENAANTQGNLSGVTTNFYNQVYPPAQNAQNSQGQPQYTPEQLRSLAEKAIKDGKDPAAVRERLKSLMGN